MIVASVLRSGGDFKPEHVYALQKMCAKYLPPQEFVCLSDVELECETILLLHDWAGWWAKMELFRLPSALYFDLDTVLTGDCTAMIEAAKHHDFVIMRDVYRGQYNPKDGESFFCASTPPRSDSSHRRSTVDRQELHYGHRCRRDNKRK